MKSEEFVSELIDLLINSVIKVEPTAPTPQATHNETPSVEGLNDVNLNYSDADYQNFAQFVSNFEVNNDIKFEPAPTPQATHDETPSVEEVCENFGLNDVNLNYSDANYQNFAQFVSDFEVNNDIKVEPPAPTPQATHDETPSVEEACEIFGLNNVNLNYSDAAYQNFAQFVSDFEVNNDIKVEPPAHTPQATHHETLSVEEACEIFGLNDVNLNYSDAAYQNFAHSVSDFEVKNDIKVEPPQAPPTPKATNDESEIRSDSQINNYIKTLLLSLLKTELAEESEEKKCLPVPEMNVELDDSTPRYRTRLEIWKRLAHEKGHKC